MIGQSLWVKCTGAVLALLMSMAVNAMPTLVDAPWLMQEQAKDDLLIIDIQPARVYRQYHIEGSVSAPFGSWRTDANAVPPKSLPAADELQKKLRQLGLKVSDRVVLVATGNSVADLSAAARVFWTLHWAGHEAIAILDGGLVSYVNEHGGQYVSGPTPAVEASDYRVKPNNAILAQAEDMRTTQQPLLDARSLEEYIGLVAGEGEQPGTLKGAANLPYDLLSVGGRGKLRGAEVMQALFEYSGMEAGKGAVHFCHTGNRASLTWFVDYAVLGNKDARLYDASMIEWASDPKNPVEFALQ